MSVAPEDLPPHVLDHLRREYEGVFDTEQLRRHVADYFGPDVAGQQVALIATRTAPGGRVLDIGSGFGSFVIAGRQAGFTTFGVEVAPVELAYASERSTSLAVGTGVFLRADARLLPFPGESFDAVTLWNVIEHVEDTRRVLEEAARVLRGGGVLFLLAPNYAAPRREAHYHVAWPPLLPARLGASYLRARGRDPRFFLEQVRPCSNRRVRRHLRELGLLIEELVTAKFDHPETIAGDRGRRIVRQVAALGAGGLARAAVRAVSASPIAPSIGIIATKRRQ